MAAGSIVLPVFCASLLCVSVLASGCGRDAANQGSPSKPLPPKREFLYATDWRAPSGWGELPRDDDRARTWSGMADGIEAGDNYMSWQEPELGLSHKPDAPFPKLAEQEFAFRWDVEGRPPSLHFSLIIREDGSASLVRPVERGWTAFERFDFALSAAEVAELRTVLQEVKFTELSRHFSPEDHVDDGTWWDMYLRSGYKLKHVSCSNAYPEEVRWIAVNVIRKILVPREDLLQSGAKVEPPSWAFEDTIPD